MIDEASLGLSPILTRTIFELIVALNEQGTTVLLVEQNIHMALKICDRAYVMKTGQVVLSGTGQELLANTDVRKAYIGERGEPSCNDLIHPGGHQRHPSGVHVRHRRHRPEPHLRHDEDHLPRPRHDDRLLRLCGLLVFREGRHRSVSLPVHSRASGASSWAWACSTPCSARPPPSRTRTSRC